MKLIVSGASGFVAKEVIRQSLSNPQITSVVALSRSPVTAPERLAPAADLGKLNSVVLKDYGEYDDAVKEEFKDATACIWTVGVTPSQAKNLSWEEVTRVTHDCTVAGIKAIASSRDSSGMLPPLRFMYMSGNLTERDQTKIPPILPETMLLRGRVENYLLRFAADPSNNTQVCVAKSGLIKEEGQQSEGIFADPNFPSVKLAEISAAMIAQVLGGFEKEPLMNDDLVRLGREVLGK